jgi:hypothetical protein
MGESRELAIEEVVFEGVGDGFQTVVAVAKAETGTSVASVWAGITEPG